MRSRMPAPVSAALLSAFCCAIAATPASLAAGPGPSVSITDSGYQPPSLVVAQHDAVFWSNDGSRTHTVTADDGSFDSGQLAPRDSFGHVFETAGIVRYHDLNDPAMRGTITVSPREQTALPTGPTAPAGTLPPDFRTPQPAVSQVVVAPSVGIEASPSPDAPPAVAASGSSAGLIVGGLLIAVAAVGGLLWTSRRGPRR